MARESSEVRKQKRHRNRKWGRNKVKCQRYAAEHRRTRNNPARTRRENEQAPHGRR